MRGLAAIVAGVAAGLAAVEAAAQPLDTAGMVACRVRGYAMDTDPKGTNVRSAPRADAPIIGRLAPPKRLDRETVEGVEFTIVGSRDGWLLIKDADYGGLTFDKAHAGDGRGWVSARLVRTQLRVAAFRAAPRRDAPEIVRLAGADWGPSSVNVSAVHGCEGQYMEVTAVPVGGKPVRGWSYLPCSSQLTACDGGITE
jgi:hypothetical protein